MRLRLCAIILLLVSGCSSTAGPEGVLSGRTRVYQDGLPDFDLEVLVDPTEDGFVAHLGIPLSGLVFVEAGPYLEAVIDLEVEVRDREGDLVLREGQSDTLRVVSGDVTESHRPMVRSFRLRPGVGRYRVGARVTDMATGASASRGQQVDLASRRIGDLHLLAGGEPELALFQAADAGPLTARVPMLQGAPVSLEWTLVRYISDRAPASEPYGLGQGYGSREYRGVLYERPDTLERRRISVDSTFSWTLPTLEPGVYRLGLSADTAGVQEELAFSPAHRTLLIRDAGFPRLRSLDLLIDALEYIATPEEMEQMQGPSSPSAKRAAFDAFWGRLIGDPRLASDIIARYYARAEQANRLYSGYKEGWRTDRGMVFMVMGPPLVVDFTGDTEIWFYSYDQERGNDRRFVFERVTGFEDDLGLTHMVLTRTLDVERPWRLAVRRWREGEIR